MPSTRRIIAVGAVLAVAAPGIAFADETPAQQPMGPAQMQEMMQSGQHPMGPAQMQEMMRQHHPEGMMPMHPGMRAGSITPTMPGQDAFGAIQEIVRILEADPKTDWSKVDLEALRQHLIDMNEVTLKADAAQKPIEGGLEIAVTGTDRALVAIQRMIPAYAQTVNGLNGWAAKADTLPNGELLTVTANDPKEVQHIRSLVFIGLLVSGSHHQMHHLAIAKGEFDQRHLGQTH
jgi:hypothetical protein